MEGSSVETPPPPPPEEDKPILVSDDPFGDMPDSTNPFKGIFDLFFKLSIGGFFIWLVAMFNGTTKWYLLFYVQAIVWTCYIIVRFVWKKIKKL